MFQQLATTISTNGAEKPVSSAYNPVSVNAIMASQRGRSVLGETQVQIGGRLTAEKALSMIWGIN